MQRNIVIIFIFTTILSAWGQSQATYFVGTETFLIEGKEPQSKTIVARREVKPGEWSYFFQTQGPDNKFIEVKNSFVKKNNGWVYVSKNLRGEYEEQFARAIEENDQIKSFTTSRLLPKQTVLIEYVEEKNKVAVTYNATNRANKLQNVYTVKLDLPKVTQAQYEEALKKLKK